MLPTLALLEDPTQKSRRNNRRTNKRSREVPPVLDTSNSVDLETHAALLELASDAVFVRDMPGIIKLWNHSAERIYGWNKKEAVGRPVADLLKTKYPVPFRQIADQLLKSGYWEGELVHTRKDGEQRTVDSRWTVRREGTTPIILELNTDITDRKRSEEQLRLLSGRLMQIQDEERRRIARDLHDSTGQKLVALKLILEQKKYDGASRQEEVKLVDDVLQEIRTVSQLLHPPLLEEAGLLSAARWLADGFSSRAGIKVQVKANDGIHRLAPHVEIALFRVIQEALNNIHRHSGAKTAEIEVAARDNNLLLRITDDGHGAKSKESGAAAVLGVGLLGMRERLAQLGGTLNINSTSNGTTIEARVPIEVGESKT